MTETRSVGIDEKLGAIFSDDEDETQELNNKDKDQQRRTEILDHFDIEPVPGKIEKSLRERRRTDSLSISIAKLLSFINTAMLLIGIAAIIMAIIRGRLGRNN